MVRAEEEAVAADMVAAEDAAEPADGLAEAIDGAQEDTLAHAKVVVAAAVVAEVVVENDTEIVKTY